MNIASGSRGESKGVFYQSSWEWSYLLALRIASFTQLAESLPHINIGATKTAKVVDL